MYYLLVDKILKLKVVKIIIVGINEFEYQVENLENNHQFQIRGAMFCKSLFLTKSEAEKALEGLKNG